MLRLSFRFSLFSCCGLNLQIPLCESIKNQSNFGDIFFFIFWQFLKTFSVQLGWAIISSWFCWYCLDMPVSNYLDVHLKKACQKMKINKMFYKEWAFRSPFWYLPAAKQWKCTKLFEIIFQASCSKFFYYLKHNYSE